MPRLSPKRVYNYFQLFLRFKFAQALAIRLTLSKILSQSLNIASYNNQSPVQFHPSPMYPGLHVQLYAPSVLLQNALKLQLWVFAALHSSTSEIILINSKSYLCNVDSSQRSIQSVILNWGESCKRNTSEKRNTKKQRKSSFWCRLD